MPRAHRLHRLTFTAIRGTPQRPVLFIGNGITAVPELGRDPAVCTIFQKTSALATLDLVTDLSAELEIQSHIVDAPGAVGFHVNTIIRIGDEVLEFPCS